MSNGARCCAARVCCPADANARIAALASLISEEAEHAISEQAASDAAKVVLENFDVVPVGVGEAIVDGYKDWFMELCP
jgi:hypothetical protein